MPDPTQSASTQLWGGPLRRRPAARASRPAAADSSDSESTLALGRERTRLITSLQVNIINCCCELNVASSVRDVPEGRLLSEEEDGVFCYHESSESVTSLDYIEDRKKGFGRDRGCDRT